MSALGDMIRKYERIMEEQKKKIERYEEALERNQVKFEFFNDTNREVSIHPATLHYCKCNMNPIKQLEVREFILHDGTNTVVKLWGCEEKGLSILVSSQRENE